MPHELPVFAVQRERLLSPRHGRAIDRKPGIDELVLHACTLSALPASTVASLFGLGLYVESVRPASSHRPHREQPQPNVDRVDGVMCPARTGARRKQQEGARGADEIPLDTHEASGHLRSASRDRPEAHAHARGVDRDEGKRARGCVRPERLGPYRAGRPRASWGRMSTPGGAPWWRILAWRRTSTRNTTNTLDKGKRRLVVYTVGEGSIGPGFRIWAE
jgi:hypothetical protein